MSTKDDATKALTLKKVSVKRKLETITADVFAHELEILTRIHHEEDVNVINENAGTLEIPDDADIELRRLQAKYNTRTVNVVGQVYRNAREVAKASGLTLRQKAGERAPASSSRGAERRNQAAQKKAATG